jgi:uncharacterized membrane protein YraQ (UPF0718 family)
MESAISFIAGVLAKAIAAMLVSLAHNWIPLSLAILTASVMKVHINVEKLKQTMLNRPKVSILSGIAAGAFTPLCACGTMAVVLGLLTTALPWGPIMAFLTSSPLMSPDGFIMLAGIINLKFAIALAVASVVIGLVSGYATHWIEKKTSFLHNQSRFSAKSKEAACACTQPVSACCDRQAVESPCCARPALAAAACGSCGTADIGDECAAPAKGTGFLKKLRLKEILRAIYQVGIKQILFFFAIFVMVGFLINYFVPAAWIITLFSSKTIFAVPLAALIGFPLYVSGESAIPLVQALMAGGAGGGSMLAFMITGAATSAWVIAGISAFMKRRIIGLYILYILVGGIVLGYLFDLVLALGV